MADESAPRTIWLTKGLPASGKTSWARQKLAENDNLMRVSRDDFRQMLNCRKYSPRHEELVISLRDLAIRQALLLEYDVIVDETFANPVAEQMIRAMIQQFCDSNRIPVLIHRIVFDKNVEDCIRDDATRPDGQRVGETVIRDLHERFSVHSEDLE